MAASDITDSDHLLRDQFIVCLKAGFVQRALQEKINTEPTPSFYNAMVDEVVWEQEEMVAKVAVTKIFEPAYLKEEALTPSPLSTMQN